MENTVLTSKSNPLAVQLAKLSQKKYRDEQGLFLLDGEKLFCEAVAFGASIEYVILTQDYFAQRAEYIKEKLACAGYEDMRLTIVSDAVFEKITTEKSPQGIITVAKTIDFFEKYTKIYNNEKFYSEPRSTVMLCELRDPGNLGTVLRSACAFETDAVYITNGCTDIFSPKVVRGSMGALFKAPIRNGCDALTQISELRALGVRVYAAALDRDAICLDRLELAQDDSVCFVIGNEGHGLSREVIDECDGSVFIPMAQNTESLNASTASSILMWELYKRKRK